MTEYPQNTAYEKTCETCRFAVQRQVSDASPWTLICKNVSSKRYEERMKPTQSCAKYEPVDKKTGTLF